MGTTQTQNRDLPDGPWLQYLDYKTAIDPARPYGKAPSSLTPTQTTTSYRTSDDGATDEEIAAEWLRVTSNGFTTNSRYDNGHEFFTTKTSHRFSHKHFVYEVPTLYGIKQYSGPLVPNAGGSSPWGTYPAVVRLSQTEIADYGSRAISATAPTAPKANLATFLGEARESLPSVAGLSVLKDRAQGFKAYGSEYLNVQFGWKPFVSDIRKMVQALQNSSAILHQFERDSGRVVRRRYGFPDVTTSSFIENANNYADCLSGLGGSAGDDFLTTANRTRLVSREDTMVQKTWFSGAFQYALPISDDVVSKLEGFEARANHLLGTRLTPEVLWELTPWSWLLDWVGTIGQSISAATLLQNDSLVIRYGYLMRQTVQQRTYRVLDLSFRGQKSSMGTISHTLRRETKERVRATPYGFGLTPASFTAQQWAILGALGLTKSPRSLH